MLPCCQALNIFSHSCMMTYDVDGRNQTLQTPVRALSSCQGNPAETTTTEDTTTQIGG